MKDLELLNLFKHHESCKIITDKNGYYCSSHHRWIHKYKWVQGKNKGSYGNTAHYKIINFRNHKNHAEKIESWIKHGMI